MSLRPAVIPQNRSHVMHTAPQSNNYIVQQKIQVIFIETAYSIHADYQINFELKLQRISKTMKRAVEKMTAKIFMFQITQYFICINNDPRHNNVTIHPKAL